MKTSSYQSSNYDYTGRSVIIQQQQEPSQQREDQFPDSVQSILLDGYLEDAAQVKQQQQYVVDDPSSDDVAIVSSSAPSVGRSGKKGGAVAGEVAGVVVVEDDGQILPRYPTIQFAAGPSTLDRTSQKPVLILPEDVSVILSSGNSDRSTEKYNAQQPQVVIAKVTSTAKRKRDTGEYPKREGNNLVFESKWLDQSRLHSVIC